MGAGWWKIFFLRKLKTVFMTYIYVTRTLRIISYDVYIRPVGHKGLMHSTSSNSLGMKLNRFECFMWIIALICSVHISFNFFHSFLSVLRSTLGLELFEAINIWHNQRLDFSFNFFSRLSGQWPFSIPVIGYFWPRTLQV